MSATVLAAAVGLVVGALAMLAIAATMRGREASRHLCPGCDGSECELDCAYPRVVDYESKCRRRRTDGPTPCLCCPAECVG